MTSEAQPSKHGGGRILLIDTERDETSASESTSLLGDARRDDNNNDDADASSFTKPSWDGAADFEGLPWYHRPSIYWLIGPYFLFTLAFGGSLVPKLNL